jgi:hypothetical protein
MVSEDPKVNEQGTADKIKHVTLMIPKKLQIIRRLETGKCCGKIHLIINHLWYKEWKDQLQTFTGSSDNLGQDSYFFINWNFFSLICARLKEFNISPFQPSQSTCTPSQYLFQVLSEGLSPVRWFPGTTVHQKKSMISTA